MTISIDISYYPLGTEHIPHILDFIQRLKSHPGLLVRTNGLSTQVFGDFEEAMDAVKREIRQSFELPNSVFIIKIVNTDQSAV